MADAQLFEETFIITKVDKGTYDRVARVFGEKTGTSQESITMTLDINTDLYPLTEGESITMLLATSLNLDGSKEETDQSWREQRGPSLADSWEYVMHGRIFSFKEDESKDGIKVQASFGGLLLMIDGPYKKITPLRTDHTYILLKR